MYKSKDLLPIARSFRAAAATAVKKRQFPRHNYKLFVARHCSKCTCECECECIPKCTQNMNSFPSSWNSGISVKKQLSTPCTMKITVIRRKNEKIVKNEI